MGEIKFILTFMMIAITLVTIISLSNSLVDPLSIMRDKIMDIFSDITMSIVLFLILLIIIPYVIIKRLSTRNLR